mmetsp:Transcript_47082/g.64105  ORF Transcript_47082/g.64105 Transcript_47082/m.64105 type:complete len:557 (-) Transcript_47082:308-1978(-)|eukprot:CAMPEP_0185773864 /NCGR_PEP_ID=MMETSP1174-20130828/75379_1 /TAXON_ID=35687 /ORGANISM="Dictyocha speculum, Strain CCMP1381" /LENGTH=556 /DNA_ID=CAMNT_0028460731 /DNA_START=33 /DNA_END=1703 /DNA_ORIENTATION=-
MGNCTPCAGGPPEPKRSNAPVERKLFDDEPDFHVDNMKLFLERMREAEDDVLALTELCESIGKFAKKVQETPGITSTDFDYEGACELTVGAMHNFPDNEGLQYQACIVIRLLSHPTDKNSRSIKGKLYQLGAFEVIGNAMFKFAGNPVTLTQALFALRNLTYDGDQYRTKALQREGFSDFIINTIPSNLNNIQVLKQVSWLIFFLTDGLRAEGRKKELDAKGLSESVNTMMEAHADNAEMFTLACCIALNMTMGSEERRMKLHDMNMCEKVLKATREHIKNRELIFRALSVVRNFATGPGADVRKKTLDNLGVCDLVLASINMHMSAPEVVTQGLMAITNLSGGKGELNDKFIDLGAADTLVKAIKLHEHKTELLKFAFWFIRNVTTGSEARKNAFFELEISDVAAAVIVDCSQKTGLTAISTLTQVFYALQNLCGGSNFELRRQACVDAGLTQSAIDTMRKYSIASKDQSSIDSLLESVCLFVDTLSSGAQGAEIKVKLLEEGFVDVANLALENCKDEKAIRRLNTSILKVEHKKLHNAKLKMKATLGFTNGWSK